MPTAAAALERSLEMVHLTEQDKCHELPAYKHGSAPAPPPRCQDPLPDVEKTFEEMNETVMDQRLKQQDQEGQNFFNRLVEGAKKGIKTLTGNSVESACNKFADNFPSLLECERLVGQFPCQLCCTDGRLNGSVMLSTNHLIFLGDDPAIKICVPMKNVVSYKLSAPTNVAPNEPQDYVKPVETLVSVTDVKESEEIIEFFLRSDHVLVLQGVKNLRDCVNIFDHIWRSCGPTPVLGTDEHSNVGEVECTDSRGGTCTACTTGTCDKRSINVTNIPINEEDKRKLHKEVDLQSNASFLPSQRQIQNPNLRAEAQCNRSSTTEIQCAPQSKKLAEPEDQTCPGCRAGRCDQHRRSDWSKDAKERAQSLPNDSPHVI